MKTAIESPLPSPTTDGESLGADRSDGNSAELSDEARSVLERFWLEEITSHLLRRAHFMAEDMFTREFAAESLTPRQKAALVVVAQHEGLKQSELAERLCMDRNTVAEMVKRLCANGMLIRSPSEDDQRAYRLHIGTQGIDVLNRVLPRDSRVEDDLLGKLPEEYRSLFIKCLKMMVSSEAK